MVEYGQPTPDLDRTFGALSDPTRRAILSRLRAGSLSVGEIALPFEVSLAAVSKHVRVLERAGLVRREVRGREHRCSLEARPLAQAAEWTDRYRAFWEGRLEALTDFLDASSDSLDARRPEPRDSKG